MIPFCKKSLPAKYFRGLAPTNPGSGGRPPNGSSLTVLLLDHQVFGVWRVGVLSPLLFPNSTSRPFQCPACSRGACSLAATVLIPQAANAGLRTNPERDADFFLASAATKSNSGFSADPTDLHGMYTGISQECGLFRGAPGNIFTVSMYFPLQDVVLQMPRNLNMNPDLPRTATPALKFN